MHKSATKVLSENDLGMTNSHQAGILIPKSLVGSGVFDPLSTKIKNPRERLKCWDSAREMHFFPTYIFYNNRYFLGTRCEYRLTGMTAFFRENGLRPGDEITFTRTGKFDYNIVIERVNRKSKSLSEESWTQIYGSK